MTPYETLMVRVLDHMTPEEIDGPVESLGNIAATIGYPVEVVRAVAKDAKGMGYCKLSTLVNLDEGYPMGSGYLRTGAGATFVHQRRHLLIERKNAKREVLDFLVKWVTRKGVDPNMILSLDLGTEAEAHLRVSNLRRLCEAVS